MAHLTATEANLLAFPLALGLITDTPPAPKVGDTIINTKSYRRTGYVIAERVGTIARIDRKNGAWNSSGAYLGCINRLGWTTYVTKHADPIYSNTAEANCA